jgi:hypothetical protein
MERLSFGPRRQRRGQGGQYHLPPATDTLCKTILDNPTHFPDFVVSDGLVFLRDDDMWRLVVRVVVDVPR